MNSDRDYLQIRCPECAWTALCDLGDMIGRMRQAKMLRRQGQPERDLVVELFRAAGERLVCDRCATKGLIVESPHDDELDWGEARRCVLCGQTISAERLELFPQTQRCANCQTRREVRGSSQEVEYCPKCGSVMVLQASRTDGISRYRLRCEACGR